MESFVRNTEFCAKLPSPTFTRLNPSLSTFNYVKWHFRNKIHNPGKINKKSRNWTDNIFVIVNTDIT